MQFFLSRLTGDFLLLKGLMKIYGTDVDEHGRCAHYRSERDVIANKCATCGLFWACYYCHREACDHEFGRMLDDAISVVCGNCSHFMNLREYSEVESCPSCGHEFNPGCKAHRHLYFQ